MIVAIGVVIVAGVAAVLASTLAQRKEDSTRTETRPVSVSGTPLPAMPTDPSREDPAVGMTIPAVAGRSFDGTPVAFAPGEKAKVLVFLAHWCRYCQKEVPRLTTWMRENTPPGEVQVVSISTAVKRGASHYPPSRWLEREAWPLPVLADDDQNSVGKAFGIEGYPTFVVVSQEGKVLGRLAGEVSTEQWERMLLSAAHSGRLARG